MLMINYAANYIYDDDGGDDDDGDNDDDGGVGGCQRAQAH